MTTIIEFPGNGFTPTEIFEDAASLTECVVIGKDANGDMFFEYSGNDPHYINSLLDIAKASLVSDMVG